MSGVEIYLTCYQHYSFLKVHQISQIQNFSLLFNNVATREENENYLTKYVRNFFLISNNCFYTLKKKYNFFTISDF